MEGVHQGVDETLFVTASAHEADVARREGRFEWANVDAALGGGHVVGGEGGEKRHAAAAAHEVNERFQGPAFELGAGWSVLGRPTAHLKHLVPKAVPLAEKPEVIY